jgi:hypothetical protein
VLVGQEVDPAVQCGDHTRSVSGFHGDLAREPLDHELVHVVGRPRKILILHDVQRRVDDEKIHIEP